MKNNCPKCESEISCNSIFTIKALECSVCGAGIQTNIVRRSAVTLSIIVTILWYSYIDNSGKESSQILVWSGLVLIVLPIFAVTKRPVFVIGNQKSTQSILANLAFFVSLVFLVGRYFM